MNGKTSHVNGLTELRELIVNMAILPEVIYRLNVMFIKIPDLIL